MQTKLTSIVFALLIAGCIPAISTAQEADDPAKAAQNPLANVISMPLQNNASFGYGDFNKTANTLNIQPILPGNLGHTDWVIINRFIIPLPKTFPDLSTEDGTSTTGLGDINYTLWLAPPPFGKLTFGFGAVTIWPTASDPVLGSEKFSIGPSLILVYFEEKYLLAGIISQWWSTGGNPNADYISNFYFQYIFTWFLKKKWYLTTAPINLADWTAEQGQKWWIPVGGGGGKMFNIGKLPMDLSTQLFYYAARPDGGPDWEWRVTLKFIFPKGKK